MWNVSWVLLYFFRHHPRNSVWWIIMLWLIKMMMICNQIQLFKSSYQQMMYWFSQSRRVYQWWNKVNSRVYRLLLWDSFYLFWHLRQFICSEAWLRWWRVICLHVTSWSYSYNHLIIQTILIFPVCDWSYDAVSIILMLIRHEMVVWAFFVVEMVAKYSYQRNIGQWPYFGESNWAGQQEFILVVSWWARWEKWVRPSHGQFFFAVKARRLA